MTKPNTLKLTPDPTFQATAKIHVPAGSPIEVTFTFRHMTRDELQRFLASADKREPEEVLTDIVANWDLPEPFTIENARAFTQAYHGAAAATLESFLDELLGRKRIS